MECSICGKETNQGRLCAYCLNLTNALHSGYDAKALSVMFIHLIGAKIVSSITQDMVEQMKEEYSKDLLNQVNTGNPQ